MQSERSMQDRLAALPPREREVYDRIAALLGDRRDGAAAPGMADVKAVIAEMKSFDTATQREVAKALVGAHGDLSGVVDVLAGAGGTAGRAAATARARTAVARPPTVVDGRDSRWPLLVLVAVVVVAAAAWLGTQATQ